MMNEGFPNELFNKRLVRRISLYTVLKYKDKGLWKNPIIRYRKTNPSQRSLNQLKGSHCEVITETNRQKKQWNEREKQRAIIGKYGISKKNYFEIMRLWEQIGRAGNTRSGSRNRRMNGVTMSIVSWNNAMDISGIHMVFIAVLAI